MNPTETIRVGNLGTRPVLMYSVNTGTNSMIDSKKNIADSMLKNKNGFVSLNSLPIVFSTLIPSLYVFSLLSLPSGFSRRTDIDYS